MPTPLNPDSTQEQRDAAIGELLLACHAVNDTAAKSRLGFVEIPLCSLHKVEDAIAAYLATCPMQ